MTNEIANTWAVAASAIFTLVLFITFFCLILYNHYHNEKLVIEYFSLNGENARASRLMSIYEYNKIIRFMKGNSKGIKKIYERELDINLSDSKKKSLMKSKSEFRSHDFKDTCSNLTLEINDQSHSPKIQECIYLSKMKFFV